MSAIISFRADNHVKSLLEAFAVKKHITKTKVINEALTAYLKIVDEKITNQVSILNAIDKDEDYLGDEV